MFMSLLWLGSSAFTGTVKFSNEFYAAQKYFYSEAKKKFPKLAADKFYPEIPIRGLATNDDLKNIVPLSDLFEARQKIVNEAAKYPEQIYTEAFAFLSGHPGANESPGNKAKFEALEKYFYPFLYLFSSDKNYALNPEIRMNPCPLVFCLKDEKKNSISFKIFNSSKKAFSFNINETLTQSYFTLSGKKPIVVKAGQTVSIKFSVNVELLKKDSTFKLFNFIFADPAQPRVKLIMPVVLLPSKDFLSLPAHFFDFRFSYSTFFKNIDMYKDRTSGPVACGSGNCSGEKYYLQRSPDRAMTGYDFGESGAVQYNVTTWAEAGFNVKNSRLKFVYNELGNMEGSARNCPGYLPNSSAPCPADAMNNGRQIYGKRKIDFKMYLPAGKIYTLRSAIRISDLVTQPANNELSWLQEKNLVINITDVTKKELARGVASGGQLNFDKSGIPAGTYTVSVFTATENEGKYMPAFELNHLNNGNRGRFDVTLNGTFNLLSAPVPVAAKK
jgi:hypothetical protein